MFLIKRIVEDIATVVRRLFQESIRSSVSTSDSMMKIADRYAFWVVQGKTVDEIYLHEKLRKENLQATCRTKLRGYVAPEEYEKIKNSIPKTISNMFLSQSSSDSFSCSQQSFRFNTLTQSSNFSENTDSSVSDLPLSNCFNEAKSLFPTSESTNYALCSSSSKSNTTGSVLRENVRESELKQRSGQKLVEFSGKDQKNVSPYHDNKLMFGGGSRTNIMTVKRQISFDV